METYRMEKRDLATNALPTVVFITNNNNTEKNLFIHLVDE